METYSKFYFHFFFHFLKYFNYTPLLDSYNTAMNALTEFLKNGVVRGHTTDEDFLGFGHRKVTPVMRNDFVCQENFSSSGESDEESGYPIAQSAIVPNQSKSIYIYLSTVLTKCQYSTV